MATQSERTASTRGRVLDAAEELFAEQGYDATSIEDILTAAQISRGALYHHFASKQAVFEAVFQRVSDAAIERALRGAPPGTSPLETLVEVSLRWLREVRTPAVAAILIEQGPQVLGWERARELEAATSLGLTIRGIEQAQAAGELEVESAELTARYLHAMLGEAALAMSHHRPRLRQATIERSFRQVVEGLAR